MKQAHVPGYLTAAQAAERLGLTTRRVVALIRQKKLIARKIGAMWLIEEISVGMLPSAEIRMKQPRKKWQS